MYVCMYGWILGIYCALNTATMNLVDLLFNRWTLARQKAYPSFSAESLTIGRHDVWVYVAAQPQLNYAVKEMTDGRVYYLKLHWGIAQPYVFTLKDVNHVKEGIGYLVTANKVAEAHGKAIDEYMLWYTKRLLF